MSKFNLQVYNSEVLAAYVTFFRQRAVSSPNFPTHPHHEVGEAHAPLRPSIVHLLIVYIRVTYMNLFIVRSTCTRAVYIAEQSPHQSVLPS